eukprot:GHVU01165005.1.p1 GENE.GHVU01165005.1~~GHVU01165005.1.p1  ORF type:complete len:107 (+),score=2.49 GHVU01165005.1:516-836(+)
MEFFIRGSLNRRDGQYKDACPRSISTCHTGRLLCHMCFYRLLAINLWDGKLLLILQMTIVEYWGWGVSIPSMFLVLKNDHRSRTRRRSRQTGRICTLILCNLLEFQ